MKEIKKELNYLKGCCADVKRWLEIYERLDGKPEQGLAIEQLRLVGQDILGCATEICTLLDEKVGTGIYG